MDRSDILAGGDIMTKRGMLSVACVLLFAGACAAQDRSVVDLRAFFAAVEANDLPRVQAMLTTYADWIRARGPAGIEPLHVAAAAGRAQMVAFLIDAGGDINATDQAGATPLHRAAERGRKQVVALLIALGAKVDARDRTGRTPMHLAAITYDRPGAMPEKEDYGLTPEELKRALKLIAQFTDRGFAVRQKAVEELIRMGPKVLPLIRKTLAETDDGEVRLRCKMVIKALAPAQALHPDPLGGLEEGTRKEIAALVATLTEADAATRNEAVARLVAIGPIVLPLVNNTAQRSNNAEVTRCCREVARGIESARTPYGSFLTLREAPDANDPREPSIGDFEDGTLQGWFAWYGSPLTVVPDPRAHSKHWLRMDLTDDPWPGLGLHYRLPQDWSRYRAVRFSVFNPYDEVITLSMLAADTRSWAAYESRYNRDQGPLLRPGANDLEVSLASLSTGTPGSRGLDLRTMHVFRLFLGNPKKRYTLYLDHVRLVPDRPLPKGGRMLADFDGKDASKWRAERASKLRLAKRPDGAGGSALEVRFARNMQYTGVVFHDFDRDWLSADLLSMDLICPRDRPTPRFITLAIRDTGEPSQELVTALDKGVNRISVPLSLAGFAALGRVRTLTVCIESTDEDVVVFIDNVRLERKVELVHGEPEHRPQHPQARLNLDFGELPTEALARVGAVVWVPLKSGGTRAIHCATASRGPGTYALGPTSFDGADSKAPIRVWGYARYRGRWRYVRRDVRLLGGRPVTLDFNDRARFGY